MTSTSRQGVPLATLPGEFLSVREVIRGLDGDSVVLQIEAAWHHVSNDSATHYLDSYHRITTRVSQNFRSRKGPMSSFGAHITTGELERSSSRGP